MVIGASGYIGTNLVPRLVAEGFEVRATARNPEVLAAREWEGVELFEADILDRSSLEGALHGRDIAFYLVHCMAAGGDFAELERRGARNFVEAANATGLRRIVYLGGLTPREPQSQHLRARLDTGDILRRAGCQVVEIRAGMIVGPGSAAWEVIRDLVNHLPLMITPRWVRSRSTPIALEEEKAHTVATRWVEGSLACQDWNPRYGFYAKRAGDKADSLASVDALWREVLLIGNDGDFIYANPLWRMRRLIGWCLGGTATRRSRRHPTRLRVGDVFDGWRVIGLTPNERLTLLMEMRAPGAGVLEFEIAPKGSGSRVSATAYWHPAGVWGLLYWYALWPAHAFLFAGLTRAIARRAAKSGSSPP